MITAPEPRCDIVSATVHSVGYADAILTARSFAGRSGQHIDQRVGERHMGDDDDDLALFAIAEARRKQKLREARGGVEKELAAKLKDRH